MEGMSESIAEQLLLLTGRPTLETTYSNPDRRNNVISIINTQIQIIQDNALYDGATPGPYPAGEAYSGGGRVGRRQQ